MRRLLVLALALAAFAAPATAAAKVQIPASLVAEVSILEDPGLCHRILKGVRVAGYDLAEEAYELGYGENKHPSAAAVFHCLVRQCRG